MEFLVKCDSTMCSWFGYRKGDSRSVEEKQCPKCGEEVYATTPKLNRK